jgi:hypothetical protein
MGAVFGKARHHGKPTCARIVQYDMSVRPTESDISIDVWSGTKWTRHDTLTQKKPPPDYKNHIRGPIIVNSTGIHFNAIPYGIVW